MFYTESALEIEDKDRQVDQVGVYGGVYEGR
jgi:hypothetical protein